MSYREDLVGDDDSDMRELVSHILQLRTIR